MHSATLFNSLLFVVALLLCSLLQGNALGADGEFVLRFGEYAEVGDRYHMQMNAKQSLTRSVLEGEQVLQTSTDETTIEFIATVEVLEVNQRRQATKRKYLVEKAKLIGGENEMQFFEAGDVIIATDGDDAVAFELESGDDMTEAQQHVASKVIAFDTGEVTLGRLYGSETPRRVGESWDADPELVVKLLEDHGIEALKSAVSGQARLVSAEAQEDETILELEFVTTVKQADAKSPLPFAEPEIATITVTQQAKTDEDATKGPIWQLQKIESRQVLTGKADTLAEGKIFDASSIESREVSFKRLAAEESK
jgi:hypothetical protein